MNTRDVPGKGAHDSEKRGPTSSLLGNGASLTQSPENLEGPVADSPVAQHRPHRKRTNAILGLKSPSLWSRITALSTGIKTVIVAIATAVIAIVGFGDTILKSPMMQELYKWYQGTVAQDSEKEQEFEMLRYYVLTRSEQNAKDLFLSLTNKYDRDVIQSFLRKSENEAIRQRLKEMGVLDNVAMD